MARGLLQCADTLAEGGCGSFDGWRFFNFGDKCGADDSGIRETAKNRNMARERNAKADGDGELSDAARPPQESGEIVGQRIFRSGHTGARDEVEKSRGTSGDFREALVGGSRRAKENRIEMMSGKNLAIVIRFFRR